MHANVLKNNNTYTAAKIAKMEKSLVREKQSHANCKQQAIPCAYLHVPTDSDTHLNTPQEEQHIADLEYARQNEKEAAKAEMTR